MASADPPSDAISSRDLQLQELIFSCSICQATVNEIYASREHNKGFHSGSGDDDGVVTRLWLAECAHAFCGKHLSGGAAPFHPEGQQPVAACPQCLRERGDDAPKQLFGIRGLTDGEHDPNIPSEWFQCPPLKMDGSMPGMDAMRFQYMALARFSQKAHRRWNDAEQKRGAAEQAQARERKHRNQLQTETKKLETKLSASSEASEKAEAQLEKWRDRQPIINHYLGIVKTMADDMAQMRAQLNKLGYEYPERDYSFKEDGRDDGDGKEMPSSRTQGRQNGRSFSSSSTAVAERTEASSARKRKLADLEADTEVHRGHVPMAQHHTSSRHMMAPPFSRPTRAPARQPQPDRSTVPFVAISKARQVDHLDAGMTGLVHKYPEMPPSRARLPSLPLRDLGNQSTLPRRELSVHSGTRARPSRQIQYAGYEPSVPSREGFVNSRLGQPDRGYNEPSLYSPHRATYAGQPQIWAENCDSMADYRATQVPDNQYDNSPISGQGASYCREPMRNLPQTQLPWRPPRETQQPYQTPHGPPSPVKVNNRAGPSVVSPFFKRNGARIQMAASQGPPTRGSVSSERRTAYPYDQDRLSRASGPMQSERQRNLSLYGQQSASYGTMCTVDHDVQPWTTSLPRRQLTIANYTPRNLTRPRAFEASPFALAAAPSYVPQSRQSGVGMSQTTAPRRRITLPMSAVRTQDVELASVPGVRGASSQQRGRSSCLQHRGPVYQDSRPLFSAAGRRSVRR